MAVLQQAAKDLCISVGLKSSNTTRFTSIIDCLESVSGLEPAFQAVLRNKPQVIAASRRNQLDVKAIIEDR